MPAHARTGLMLLALIAAPCGFAAAAGPNTATETSAELSTRMVPPDEVLDVERDPAAAARKYPADPRPVIMMARRALSTGDVETGVARARDAVRVAGRTASLIPVPDIVNSFKMEAFRTLVLGQELQGDLKGALETLALEKPVAKDQAELRRTEMRIAFAAGDIRRAKAASEELDALPRTPQPKAKPGQPGTASDREWALPAQVRLASGDPKGAIARLATNGPSGPPPTDLDKGDALVVEGLATLAVSKGADDDREAFSDLAKPAELVPDDPGFQAWAAVATMLAGGKPGNAKASASRRDWPAPVLPALSGQATANATRASLEERWSAMQAPSKAAHGAPSEAMARTIAAERCDADFLLAVRLGADGARDWVDQVTKVADACPANLDVAWASKAIARRWKH